MKPTQNKASREPVRDSFKMGEGYINDENTGIDIEPTPTETVTNDQDIESYDGIDFVKKPPGKTKDKLKKHHH